MYWNYRIIKVDDGYGLFEVYYFNKDKSLSARCENPISWGETKEELQNTLLMMLVDSLKHPVLEDKDTVDHESCY